MSAATWIHYYAITALGLVVLPRIALTLMAKSRARRLAAGALPFDARAYPELAKVLQNHAGAGLRVIVVPYSHQPKSSTMEVLRVRLSAEFGGRADIEVLGAVEYGDGDPERLLSGSAGNRTLCVVVNLAQTPEKEVHGAWLVELRRAAEECDPSVEVRVFVDDVPYRDRFGKWQDPDRRMEERWAAWAGLVESAGLRVAPVWLAELAPQS